MENPLAKRLFGLLLLGIGIALAVWLKQAHDTGAEIEDRAIIFTPMLLLYGLVSMVYPSVMISKKQMATAPVGLRVFSFMLALVGVAIGLWLRFVVFKDWVVSR